jgi:uncharacterized membrane protein
MIDSQPGVLAALAGIAAFFFYLHQRTGWRLFDFFPPLLWIYATPVLLNNIGVLPSASPVYGALREIGLPFLITMMLLTVNVPAVVRVMGRGVLVMLLGTLGIVVGGVVAYALVHRWLAPDAWTGFGALAGSWIGGTGNMAAMEQALGTPPEQMGLAVLADNLVYVVWLPILLGSKAFAERFNRWARVSPERLERLEAAAADLPAGGQPVAMRDYLYLFAVGLAVTASGHALAPAMPVVGDVLTESVWRILLTTTFALLLSATPIRRIPGSHELGVALVYVFVASIGARASLAGLGQAPAFLLGAYIWIFIHGLFCLAGAWLFRVDVHSVAIASAANVGGAASAPLVAAYHREGLVPVAVLMALIGYALGNYLAILTGHLCRWVGSG